MRTQGLETLMKRSEAVQKSESCDGVAPASRRHRRYSTSAFAAETAALRFFHGFAAVCLWLMLVLAGCGKNNEVVTSVQGTWRSEVSITSCEPAGPCEDAGFVQGAHLFAVLVLTQVRSELNGTYSYEGSPITVPVSGRVGESVVALNGVATIPLGSVTATFSGNLSGDTMPATITHQITLVDGRAANISVAGTFTR